MEFRFRGLWFRAPSLKSWGSGFAVVVSVCLSSAPDLDINGGSSKQRPRNPQGVALKLM